MAQVVVGAGAVRAETRRKLVRAKEERMKRDREAQWLTRMMGVLFLCDNQNLYSWSETMSGWRQAKTRPGP